MKPQCAQILQHLSEYGSVTSAEALSFYGIARCASRVSELNAAGYNIVKEYEYGKNKFGDSVRYARYYWGK